MKLSHLLTTLLTTITVSTFPQSHAAESNYPDRPINLVVPFSAGGPTDVMARLLAKELSEKLGQQVIVDNRGGAGGSIAAELVARAEPNGYTLFFGTAGTMAINPSLYKNLRYDPIQDFSPVSLMATTMNVLVVNPITQVDTLADLITLAKSKPDGLTYGSAGNGSSNHLSGELFRKHSKIDIIHVPYKGSAPALIDLLGGRISMMFDTVAQQAPNIASGKVNALAVTGPSRSPLLPDVPTAQEAGLEGFDVTIWFGILAPKNTPTNIIDRLHKEIESVMSSDVMQERMLAAGAQAHVTTPQEFADLIQQDIAKWAPIVKDSGASLE